VICSNTYPDPWLGLLIALMDVLQLEKLITIVGEAKRSMCADWQLEPEADQEST
jgi:hypothetical protein